MKKLNAKKLIEFRRMSDKRKQTFVNNLKKPPKIEEDKKGKGGDYWVSTTSAIGHSWENNDNQFVEDKIETLSEILETEERRLVRLRLQQNISMLENYVEYDFSKIRPSKLFDVKRVSPKTAPLLIKGLFIHALPNLVFNYKNRNETEAGVIWFAAYKNGYQTEELSVFAELAYRYALSYFRKKFVVNPFACIVVDVKSGKILRYSDVLREKPTGYVTPILNEINRFL